MKALCAIVACLLCVSAHSGSTVSEPRWVSIHGDHIHEAASLTELLEECAAHFPKAQANTDQVAGYQTDYCSSARYEVTVTYGPNPVPVEHWARVAQEGARVTPPAERKYRYGCDDADTTISAGCPVGDRWSAPRNFATPFTCNNSTFGGDPVYGVVKVCQVSSFSPGLVPEPAVGTAKLTWVAPTTNTDNSPLTNLTGFRIIWGEDPKVLVQSIDIPDRYAVTYTVGELPKGTWYFTVRAIAGQTESENATVVSKVIQ